MPKVRLQHRTLGGRAPYLASQQSGGFLGIGALFAPYLARAAAAAPRATHVAVMYAFALALRTFMVLLQGLIGMPEKNKMKYVKGYIRYLFSRENLVEEPLQLMIAHEITKKLNVGEASALKVVKEAAVETSPVALDLAPVLAKLSHLPRTTQL